MTSIPAHLRGVSAVNGSSKAKIERAALTLFAEHSVDGVSTKQIAAKAGFSEGTIYRHFAGKDDLARSLMREIHNRLTEMIMASRHGNDDLRSQISFIVNHYCQIADDDWVLFQYHILHLHYFPRLSERPEDSPLGMAGILLKEAMLRGEIEQSDADILAAMALGVVLQCAQAKVLGFISGPLSAHKETFKRSVFAILGLTDQEA